MSIFQQPSFWVILYIVLGIACMAGFAYLVERDLRRYKEGLAMGLEPDGEEHGWTPGRFSVVPVIGIFWPIALAWLATIATVYFFWHSSTWGQWRVGAKAWFKDCCLGVWGWRLGPKAAAERLTRRKAAVVKAEKKQREKKHKAAARATAKAQ